MMFTRDFNLQVQGVFSIEKLPAFPSTPGIYFVYACGILGWGLPSELLYIGEAQNLRERLTSHEKMTAWKRAVGAPALLGFSYAVVPGPERQRIEAAMIYRHKPPMNERNKNGFFFPTTRIRLSGRTDLLDTRFTAFNLNDLIRPRILAHEAKRRR